MEARLRIFSLHLHHLMGMTHQNFIPINLRHHLHQSTNSVSHQYPHNYNQGTLTLIPSIHLPSLTHLKSHPCSL